MKGKTKEQVPQNLIQACIVGSRLYGIATADSDWDVRGVYLMPLKILLSPFEELNTVSLLPSEDTVFYPLRKFMQMCLAGNPNVIEMLYVQPPMSVYSSAWEMILENRDKFVSARWIESMLGFARSERKNIGSSGSDDKRYKAAYHYLRMFYLAKIIITERALTFPIQEEYKERLLAVRNRDMSLQEAVAIGEEIEKEVELAMTQSWFPPYPDEETIEQLNSLYVDVCLSTKRLSQETVTKWLENLKSMEV